MDTKEINSNEYQLYNIMIEKSVSNNKEDAILEWEVNGYEIDPSKTSKCICGHHGIKYLYRIRNTLNGNELFPVGSDCIKELGNKKMKEDISIIEKQYALYNTLQEKRVTKIDITKELFSRDMLKCLYLENVFVATKYNKYNPVEDYKFLLKMFNKGKSRVSQNERGKIDKLLQYCIKPYIENKFSKKIVK